VCTCLSEIGQSYLLHRLRGGACCKYAPWRLHARTLSLALLAGGHDARRMLAFLGGCALIRPPPSLLSLSNARMQAI